MKITFAPAKPANSGTEIFPAFSDKPLVFGPGISPDAQSAVNKMAANLGYEAQGGRSLRVPTEGGQLVILSAGKRGKFDAECFAANAMKSELNSGAKILVVHLGDLDQSPDEAARAAVGARLAGYRFDHYRTKLKAEQKPTITEIVIACDAPEAAQAAYDNLHGPVTDGVEMARDLVNEPPNVIYPAAYAERIVEMGEKLGLEVEVFDEARMTKMGMNALLGVGVGSERESRMVVMRWNGGKDGDAPACLVGKGVTFDTGGISLKPGANMWDMKGDMGGSAAVVGAMMGVAGRKAKANVVGIVGLVENMPDGRAQLPGDIVTSMSGQTIEVQNTDAEGRLVLADALHYAVTEIKPDAIIDLATLTGAIIVTLGHEYAGVFTPSDALAAEIDSASEASGEKAWRLPMGPAYDKLLDSPNADMKNIGGRAAGSITAAQFLKRFVGKAKWAHIDIAGTGMKNTRTDARETTFGTGYGVRLLNHWIADNYEG